MALRVFLFRATIFNITDNAFHPQKLHFFLSAAVVPLNGAPSYLLRPAHHFCSNMIVWNHQGFLWNSRYVVIVACLVFHSGISIFLIISFLLKDLESQSLWNKEFILNTISHDPCFLLSSSSSQWASIVWSFPPLFQLPMAAWLLSHPKYHCPICLSIQGKIFLIVNHLSLQRSDD